MIKHTGIRFISAILIAGVVLAGSAVALHSVLISRVHHDARTDVQSTVREFVHFSASHEADSAAALLTEFIAQHPISSSETLVGITPEQLIQSDWAERTLHSGDSLILAATNSPDTAGMVEKSEGPVYWAAVEIENTDSSLLITRFTGMDISHTQGLIRMLASLVLAGVTVAGALWWWIFRRTAPAPPLRVEDLGTVGRGIEEHSALTLAHSPDPQVAVRVDIAALGTALNAAAEFCHSSEVGLDIQDHTVTLLVYSRDIHLTSHQLNTVFSTPDLSLVQEIAQQHGAIAWVESAPHSGLTIGIELPIHQDRRNHANHY